MSQPSGGPNPMIQILDLAEQMNQVMARFQPEGMLEVLAAYDRWPDVQDLLVKVWQRMHTAAAQAYPLNPVVLEFIQAVAKNQRATAQAARDISPTVRKLHRRELEDLQDRRKAMWDHRANRGRA